MNGNKTDIGKLTDFVILYLQKLGIEINHLKLQKLLYYIQAWHLAYFERNPLFDDEPQAWVEGPVYRSVYDRFKGLGKYDCISLPEIDDSTVDEHFQKAKASLDITEDQFGLIGAVLDKYGPLNHGLLVLKTHQEPPWNDARKGLDVFQYCENIISHESMSKYFESKLNPV